MKLSELHRIILDCTKCGLCESRTQAVPGDGPEDARIMFIGEGPGEQEDLQGKPFVGPAGKLLNELLIHAGLKRAEVFITNIVKCRPPSNRTPAATEVAACRDYLVAQIAHIRPAIICPLGGPALQAIVDEKLSISQLHGRRLDKHGLLFFPMYHPAAALHKGNLRQTLFDDILKLRRLLNELPQRQELTAGKRR